MGNIKSKICICVFISIVGSLLYLMNFYTPMCGDDYLYSFYLTPVAAKSFFEGTLEGFNQRISSISDVFYSQYNHYFYVNGRTVPHVFEQIFAGLLGDKWFNIFNVSAFLLLNLLVLWNVDKKKLCSFGYWVITFFLLWFFLPYPVDTALLMSGSVNYVWSAVLCLSFLLVYSKVSQVDRVNWKIVPFLFLLGFVAGWTHEVLVIGISGALFLKYCIYYKKRPRCPEVVIVTGFWLGTLLLCLSPAARGRAFIDHSSIWETAFIVIKELRALYIFLFLLIYALLYEKKRCNYTIVRKFIRDNQLYIYVVVIEIIFSLFIGYRNVRQLFGIELFSIILSLKFICILFSFDKTSFKLLSFVVAGVIVLHMICIIPYAKRSYSQYQDLVESYNHSEDGNVCFKKEVYPNILDKYVWRFGGYVYWETLCVSIYYTGNEKQMKIQFLDE